MSARGKLGGGDPRECRQNEALTTPVERFRGVAVTFDLGGQLRSSGGGGVVCGFALSCDAAGVITSQASSAHPEG